METKDKLRIGIIGLGGVAKAQLQGIEELDNVRIASVCDLNEKTLSEIARRYEANAYTKYEELLMDNEIDLALILTPASTHEEIARAVAERGVHVFCEKPLAVTLEDAKKMVAHCKKAGVKLFYGSCYRYLPAVRKAYELIRTGSIGGIQLMTEQVIGGHGLDAYRELSPVHYPLGGPGGPGMGLVDHGIHLIDIFSWFTQSEITSVQGSGRVSGEGAGSEYMVMKFANGAIGHLLYNAATYSTRLPNEGMFSGGQGWLADGSLSQAGHWEKDPGYISVYGTKGALRIFHYSNDLFLNDDNGLQRVELDGRPAFGHFATQLSDCVDAIFEDREPSVSGEDGVKALNTLLKVYQQ